MKRIYADFNDIAEDGALRLTCKGSVDSIAALGEELSSGQEVVLSDNEMEVIARVFRLDGGSWEARSDWRFVDLVPFRSGA
jgi:hypothetical protein